MDGYDVGAAVGIGERDRDRHLALHRRIFRLELDNFHNLLVWYELDEAAVVRIGVRTGLADPSGCVVGERDPEGAAFATACSLRIARYTFRRGAFTWRVMRVELTARVSRSKQGWP